MHNKYRISKLAELHGDLFSRHASPLEGYIFVVVDDRGEDVLSDEICRRCNRKQQKKETWRPKCTAPRLHSDIYARMYTYALCTRPKILGRKTKTKQPPEVRSRDGHVEHVY